MSSAWTSLPVRQILVFLSKSLIERTEKMCVLTGDFSVAVTKSAARREAL